MKTFFATLLTLNFLFFTQTSLAAPAKTAAAAKEVLAEKAANEWLTLVDKKDYKQSWEDAATYFKSKVNARDWSKMVAGVREPFGKLISRKLKAKLYSTSVPGAPEGEYVVIQYDAQYQNRKNVLETVTPMFDDSKWRVSGYFAK